MAGPRITTFDSLLTSAAELQGSERWPPLERTLSQALATAITDAQSQAVLEALLLVPQIIRSGSADWQILTLWALCVNRRPEEMLAFARPLDLPAAAEVYRAWALVRVGSESEALELLNQVWDNLSGEVMGFAWRARAQALAALGLPGWSEAFQQAAERLTGRRRSLCLAEQGYVHDRAGQGIEARIAWREALGGLSNDVFHLAWLRFNLGMSAFRDGAPEAEQHFLTLTELARQAPARPFASRAWSGLGTFRRLQGEWKRAEAAYREAARLAGTDREDELQAWRGVGHVRRLQGLPESSLEDFGRAVALSGQLGDRQSGQSGGRQTHWIHVDVAAVWAQLAQPDRAAQELALAGEPGGVDGARAALVRAELARLGGDQARALGGLRALNLCATWASEERSCFPVLFALAEANGVSVPVPLDYVQRTHVEVRAAGILTVRVNGRLVPLPPTGRAAELLVMLLELGDGNAASSEVLSDLLYPEADPQASGPRKQLSALARSLRQTLGWPGSVMARGGAYELDPETTWDYDVRAFRAANLPLPAFMEGVYREWVQDRQPLMARQKV